MSFCYHYFFRFEESLDQLALRFNDTFSANLKPLDGDTTVYSGQLFATEYTLTHNWIDDSFPEFDDYPFSLTVKIWGSETGLHYIHPALFFATIYMMYCR